MIPFAQKTLQNYTYVLFFYYILYEFYDHLVYLELKMITFKKQIPMNQKS